jgi:hypothetical protein
MQPTVVCRAVPRFGAFGGNECGALLLGVYDG